MESGIIPEASKDPKKSGVTRRDFLEKAAGAAVGALMAGGYDRISHGVRELSNPKVEGVLPNVIEKMKRLHPEFSQWDKPEDWAEAIKKKCEENKFPATDENRCLILTLIGAESGFRDSPRVVGSWATPSEKFMEEIRILKPRTGGPMNVSIREVMEQDKISYDKALKEVSTFQNGIGYGIRHLKKVVDLYKDIRDDNLRLKCIFADYNAGLFTSRNAGVQVVLEKMGSPVSRKDGLLSEETEQAIEKLFSKYNIPITVGQIKEDLTHKADYNFPDTQTWKEIAKLNKGDMPLAPADSPVLGLPGIMKRVLTGVGSSKDFAEHRLTEFNQIMKLILEEGKRIKQSLPEVGK